MFAETGVPVLLGLFCEVNAGVLATAAGAVAAHNWAEFEPMSSTPSNIPARLPVARRTMPAHHTRTRDGPGPRLAIGPAG